MMSLVNIRTSIFSLLIGVAEMLMDTFDYIMAAVTIAWAIVAVCVLVVKGTDWMFDDEEITGETE